LYTLAIHDYDKALGHKADRIGTLYEKAYAHTQLYEFEEADECYDKILQIDPLHADSISDKGGTLCIKGKYREAMPLFDKAL
jgi:Tfp pilus assembly protein PilF